MPEAVINTNQSEKIAQAIALIKRTQDDLPIKPALISWVRILLLPLCIYTGWNGDFVTMFWLVLTAAASDYFDGKLARKLKQSTTSGKTLDMLADKLFLSVMLIFSTRLGALNTIFALIPAWYHITLVVALLVVSWSIKKPVVAITTSERLTVIFSYILVITVSGALAYPDKSIFLKLRNIVAVLTVFSTILAIISYFRFCRRLIQRYVF